MSDVTTVPAADQDTETAGGKALSRSRVRRWLVRLSIGAAALVVLCIAGLTALIFTTSAPQIPPKVFASPNAEVQARISAGQDSAAAQTDLAYENAAQPRARGASCGSKGRWSLAVNPEDVVGHPYAVTPGAHDWSRAAAAIGTANAICPAPVVLTWYGHDPAHPTSDTWTALLPASVAAAIDGPTLRRYTLRHARQG